MDQPHNQNHDQEHSRTHHQKHTPAPDLAQDLADTRSLQQAIEDIADQETAQLPHLPHIEEAMQAEPASEPDSDDRRQEQVAPEPDSLRADVQSWFTTFMCMNLPIVGWFYLSHLARHGQDDRRSFAQAYLFYKLVFLAAGFLLLILLLVVGLSVLDRLLAYIEML